ncbi:exodeoxyribonuclease III [Pedobacter puniceum]|uniref:Exodeoxyribonuclease III n=1 Tax=Pedobacter puniceum TaxID=2666136 RepID=A0A7K0FR97_9SPHI|nr:exodeoxyribonuclease III [Pedobacter puniceum]MRX48526.1 exodeoxyribonuclease III [Pedobacter puniceum]
MKIISYNVNGIRAAINKEWLSWLQATNADIVCLQEIKATPDQIADLFLIEQLGYYHYWYPAQKKGYSGTAILSKKQPNHVEYGCGITEYDTEGRTIRADFEDFSIMSAYFPSGSSGEERQDFKFKFLDDFYIYSQELKERFPKLIICGDYNICHKAIDIHNPKSNANSSGFLPEERAWMEKFIESGYIDTFRYFNQDPHHYTWWSYRAGARAKNLGWRIDYHLATKALEPHLKRASILPEAKHSDHCPIVLELSI